MSKRFSLGLFGLIVWLGAPGWSAPPEKPAIADLGMVSSAHILATDAGLEILRRGGNAFDAAIAVAATLNVVEPFNSGIGGYGTILVYDRAKGESRFLNCSAHIPHGVDADVFRSPTPNFEENRRGPMAVSTPGNVPAWEAMWKLYGSMKWADLFGPAIEVARNGFLIDDRIERLIRSAWSSFPEGAREFYGLDNSPLLQGQRLVQVDLASSLEKIAKEGAAALRTGTLARSIDEEMKRSGGFLRLRDLETAKADWWDPIRVSYRGHEVVTASPPATAFPSLIRIGLLSRFDVKKFGHNTADYLHIFSEITKHAFWCRLRYAGDPDISGPPLDRLLSTKYWEKQASAVDRKRALPFIPPGLSSGEDSHTTHFVVADRNGNIVSATQTLGNGFGSRIMPEGTGIWLNNSLQYCTFEPAGNPMDAHAGRRKLSGDCPTFLLKNGRPWAALGTPGGHTIGQTVPQMVVNLIDFEFDIQAAITASRIAFVEPDLIVVEPTISREVREELKRRGHKLRERRAIGNAHGLTLEYNDQGNPIRFFGGADPRGTGVARGISRSR